MVGVKHIALCFGSERRFPFFRWQLVGIPYRAMLLNDFLKAHRKVQELGATIAQLKKDFRATVAQLTTRLDEQAAQIQKVCPQLEASKPAPQVVSNNQ